MYVLLVDYIFFAVGDYLDPNVKLISALDEPLRQQAESSYLDKGCIQEEQIVMQGNTC